MGIEIMMDWTSRFVAVRAAATASQPSPCVEGTSCYTLKSLQLSYCCCYRLQRTCQLIQFVQCWAGHFDRFGHFGHCPCTSALGLVLSIRGSTGAHLQPPCRRPRTCEDFQDAAWFASPKYRFGVLDKMYDGSTSRCMMISTVHFIGLVVCLELCWVFI